MTDTTIADALAKAQTELLNTTKDATAKVRTKTGPDFSYGYANIASILAACRPVLGRHGIAITQDVTMDDRGLVSVTTVLRKGTEALTFGPLRAHPHGGNNPVQAIGSTITYLRRYGLEAAIGVAAASDDDDGGHGGRAPEPRPRPQDAPLRAKPQHDLFADLKESLREAFGPGTDPAAVKEADTLSMRVHGKPIAAVFALHDPAEARALLDALEAGR